MSTTFTDFKDKTLSDIAAQFHKRGEALRERAEALRSGKAVIGTPIEHFEASPWMMWLLPDECEIFRGILAKGFFIQTKHLNSAFGYNYTEEQQMLWELSAKYRSDMDKAVTSATTTLLLQRLAELRQLSPIEQLLLLSRQLPNMGTSESE